MLTLFQSYSLNIGLKLRLVSTSLPSEADKRISVGHECIILDMSEGVKDSNVFGNIMLGNELKDAFGC